MIGRARVSILIMSILFAGCGSPLLSTPGLPPPHGGNVINLPGGKGFVEVVKKDIGTSKASVAGEVYFYFLKDINTPLSPAPSSGSLTVGKRKVPLNVESEGLVTPTGPPLFPKGDPDGTLTVELDGRTVNVPLGVGR
jgi:hypothetical protein